MKTDKKNHRLPADQTNGIIPHEAPELPRSSSAAAIERRRYVRYFFEQYNRPIIYVHQRPQPVHIHNISAGGLAFYSPRKIKIGEKMLVSANRDLAIEVVIVGCTPHQTAFPDNDHSYIAHAKFCQPINEQLVQTIINEAHLK